MMNSSYLGSFTDILDDVIANSQESQPFSFTPENVELDNRKSYESPVTGLRTNKAQTTTRPAKGTGQYGQFRSVNELCEMYRSVFSYPFFNLVQSSVIDDALYSDKSMVVCAPTGSGKTVVFEMAILQLLMEFEDKQCTDDFKIIYMAPVKALCTERLTEWYPKFTKLGLMCIEVTGDTDVDFSQLKPYKIIITTPEKWDMVTRRWREHRQLVEVIKLFLIDEVHILNDETRGPVLEAVVSRMKTIEASAQSAHRIEQLQKQYQSTERTENVTQDTSSRDQKPPRIRFVAVSATVSNPGDVAAWLGNAEKPAVYYKFGDESRPVKLKRVVEGYPCPEGTSIFKFDIILNYKLWPVIQKHHNGKPTLIFCNTRKSVALTAETLSRELTVSFNPEQKAKLTALASTIKNKKLQMLVLSGIGCHHAGLLYEERNNIEHAFRNRDLPILITTTTLAMGVNLPAHLVIIKNTQQYVNGAYQEYSISTVLQMIGRAGRPQFDTEATAVIMTRLQDKARYQALVGGNEPLQSFLHKRLPENLNSEAALGTVNDVAQCVQWLRSTFLYVRAARDPKRYLGLPQSAPQQLISKKIEEFCVKAMNALATYGLITMDEASCIESTEAGRLMSVFYLDLETMKHIMKINGDETLERLLCIICESHELADMHLRMDERRCLNTLNRNNAAATIRFPMKGKISTRQMKLNCIIQAILGCLNIPDPSLNQEAMKIIRIADRVCKCLVAYVTRPALIAQQPKYYSAVLNSLVLAKCVAARMWENSQFVSRQLRGIGPTFSTLLATAGKVNFMLLEESHPRDLERIMNKGPPAGNDLRNQISRLPKYQLAMTPVDEKSVTIQLILLNHNYLSENMEQLTAGDSHKSYVVVGDSENNLLLLSSFKDKELIGVYDGVITHGITRKHSFEHKVFAHCISSSFVGIDTHCEYIFKDLEANSLSHFIINENIPKKPVSKQTTITDTFKERKRKNSSDTDITQSKEKKKRDSAILEKFKCMKESFGKTSETLKNDLGKSAMMSNKILQELPQLEKLTENVSALTDKARKSSKFTPKNISNLKHINMAGTTIANINIDYLPTEDINAELIASDEFIDDVKINNILDEIENEISRGIKEPDLPQVDPNFKRIPKKILSEFKGGFEIKEYARNMPSTSNSLKYLAAKNVDVDCNGYKERNNLKKKIHRNTKSRNNYQFIDIILSKNPSMSDEEVEVVVNESSGFSDAIKSQVEKYLEQTKTILNATPITELLVVRNEENDRQGQSKGTSSTIDLQEKHTNKNTTDYIYDQGAKNSQMIGYKKDLEIKENESYIEVQEHEKTLELAKEGKNALDNECDNTKVMRESCKKDMSQISSNLDTKVIESVTSREIKPLENATSDSETDKNKINDSVSYSYGNVSTENSNIKTTLFNPTYRNFHDEKLQAYAVEIPVPILQLPSTPNQHITAPKITCQKTSTHYADTIIVDRNLPEFPHLDNSKTKKYPLVLPENSQTRRDIFRQNKPLPFETIVNIKRISPKSAHIVKSNPYQYNNSKNSRIDNKINCKNIQTYSEGSNVNLKHNQPELVPMNKIKLGQYTVPSKSTGNSYNYSNGPKTSNDTANVKNYSYSATKIDVATGEDNVVIRKIKMDLNITEITALRKRENNRDQEGTLNSTSDSVDFEMLEMNINNEENKYNVYDTMTTKKITSQNNTETPESSYLDFNKTHDITAISPYDRRDLKSDGQGGRQSFTKMLKTKCIDFQTPAKHTDVISYNIQGLKATKMQKPNYSLKPAIERTDLVIAEAHVEEKKCLNMLSDNIEGKKKNINTKTFPSQNKDTATNQISFSTPQYEPQKKQNKYKESDSRMSLESIINNKCSSNQKDSRKEAKKIENIFQKYSIIMSSNDNKSLSQSRTQTKTNTGYTTNNTQPEKPKRPFKISDINRIETTLPKGMISANFKRIDLDDTINETHKPVNLDDMRNQIAQNIRNMHQQLEFQEDILTPETKPEELVENVYQNNTQNLITPNEEWPDSVEQELSRFKLECNTIDVLEPVQSDSEINIDRALLNPITVLQRLSNGESDFIPPPLEFCDETELLQQTCNNDTIPMDSSEQMHWENTANNSIEGSIFQDNSHIELTPREELETWTFSRHDEMYPQDLSPSPGTNSRQSFKMMHTPRQRRNSFQNISAERQNRLEQFQYCHKNKLRPKP